MACATVCDVEGDEGVSGFFSAFGDAFGDFGDFLISTTGNGSFGISTCSGLSIANELFSTPSTLGLMSKLGLLPNVKLFTASGFDESLNDDENLSEFMKMFELSAGVVMGFAASVKAFGKTLFKRVLSFSGS